MTTRKQTKGAPAKAGVTPDPLPLLGQELRAADRAYIQACRRADGPGNDTPENVAAQEAGAKRWHQAYRNIARTAATTPAGAAVKASILLEDAENGKTAHTIAIARSLIRDLKRMGQR